MTDPTQVRVACIGAGGISRRAHCPSLRDIEEARLVGICDVDPQRADALAEQFGFEAAFTDYRQMLERTAPDAVYVMVPPHLLGDIVPHCLHAGLDLLLEKPPGIAPEQTRTWARLAEKKGCTTMVAFNRRFIPVLSEARRLVEKRGPMHLITVTYVKDYQRIFDSAKAGGCLPVYLDAIHAVDAMRWLGGEVKALHSAVRAVEGVDPNTFAVLMEFESGAMGLLHAGWATGPRVHSFELHAVGASAYVDTNKQARFLARDLDEPTVVDAREVAGSDEFHVYYGFLAENRYFFDCIASGRLPKTHLGDAVRSMELCEAVMRGGWKG